MTIIASDVKFYKAAANNDLAGNGGRISSTEIVDNALNNLFPNVTKDERVAGLTRYRKMFIRNENIEELILYHTDLWIGTLSTGDDYFRMYAGDDTDIQSASELYTDWAGSGLLDALGSVGDPTIDVDYDVADGVYDGSKIYITDGVNSEENEVNGAPVWLGTVATLTLVTVLGNDYASGTKVGTMVDVGNATPSDDSWVETSPLGTYDEDTYPLELFNVGSVTDSWTLTFSDSSNFTVEGAQTGSLGAGDINTNFKPSNGSSYYFELDKDGWGGSWANGNTITFNTVHAGKSVWLKQIVPAGISSISNNKVIVSWEGESANVLTTTTSSTTSSSTSSSSSSTSSSTSTTSSTSSSSTTV